MYMLKNNFVGFPESNLEVAVLKISTYPRMPTLKCVGEEISLCLC
jgi:hypothetical protein